MKQKILIMLLLLVSMSAIAEWTKFDESIPDATHYIDFNNLKRVGDKATLWQLISFKTARLEYGLRYSSIKILSEFDCTKKLFRVAEGAAYSKTMGEGYVVDKDLGQKAKWNAIPPNSNGDFMWQSVCKKPTNLLVDDTNITGISNDNKEIRVITNENGLATFAQMKSTLMSKYGPLADEAYIHEERLLNEILDAISPAHFIEYNDTNKSKHLISEYMDVVLKIHKLNISFAKEMKMITESSLLRDFPRESLDRLNKSNDELIHLFNEFTETRYEKSNILLKIENLIEANKVTTKISNGLFIFKDQTTLNLYNQYAKDLELEDEKENGVFEKLLQNRQEFIEKLLDSTSVTHINSDTNESLLQQIPHVDKVVREALPVPQYKPVLGPEDKFVPFDWDSLTVPKLNNYTPRETMIPETDPEGSVFMAYLQNENIIGSFLWRGSSRDLSLVDLDKFNFVKHLRQDQLPDLEYYALDMSQEDINDTEIKLNRERKNKAIMEAHPWQTLGVGLVFNSPWLALLVIMVRQFLRRK